MSPLADWAQSLHAVSIPGQTATLSALETVEAAKRVGINAVEAASVTQALEQILAEDSEARVLICGSLYLAGEILKENG